jgi:NTE family protein
VLLDTGPVVDAVAASCAVPGLLPPVHRCGRTLVDGAVGHGSSLAHADSRGVDDIYLLPAGYPCAGPPPTSAVGVALTALAVMLHHQLLREVRAYAGHARLHVVPPLCPLVTSPADFSSGAALMGRARAETSDWLAGGSLAVADASGRTGADAGTDGVLSLHGPHPTTSRTGTDG